ncbi:site-specific integrase [Rhodobacter capsulatus]|uniref:site-specific integrase n=1 Tax=Rhodobacter capsulatus TaxID=1061 RepID=UPI0003D2A806|nr:tyrosine-type recombinase/integrase [Rhodobacter capsulatus]ETD82027.1 integrase [Rhodobacter capsulatus B6]
MRSPVWGIQLKGIRRQRRGDRIVKYHRASGIRLPDLPETHPDFVDAWTRAEAGLKAPAARGRTTLAAKGTLAAAIHAEKTSRAFQDLSEIYKAALRRDFDAIEAAYGTALLTGLKQRHIEADLGSLPPVAANKRLKAWRRILASAKQRQEVEIDPSVSVRRAKIKTTGFPAWTRAEIEKFREHWPIGTVQRTCFELVYWTGARTKDAVKFGPRNIDDDGVLEYRQTKTGNPALVPLSNPLPPFAKRWAAEREGVKEALACLAGGFTFLEAQGRVRSVKGLGNLISDAARDAGIKKSAHGLRKSRLTAIAEARGTSHAIMAWGGHQSLAEAERYTRAAERKRLIMDEEHDENVVSPLDPDTKTAKK